MADPVESPRPATAAPAPAPAPWRKLFWAGLLFVWLGLGLVFTWHDRIFAHWDENYADEFGPQLRLHPPARLLSPPTGLPVGGEAQEATPAPALPDPTSP
jgi:hypothetical protein